MKFPFLGPVVPPHVFCLLDEGVTYARVRQGDPTGFAEARHFRYPAGSLGGPSAGVPLLTREAIAEAVKAARALSEGRLTRASVVYPDSWARILPVELESLPTDRAAGVEMVELEAQEAAAGRGGGPRGRLRAHAGALGREARPRRGDGPRGHRGDRARVRRARRAGRIPRARFARPLRGSLGLALGRGRRGTTRCCTVRAERSLSSSAAARSRSSSGPGPPGADEDQDREARLSLSYYAERLKGPGIRAVFVHDESPGGELAKVSAFPVSPQSVSGRLLGADEGFDERIAARPELLAGLRRGARQGMSTTWNFARRPFQDDRPAFAAGGRAAARRRGAARRQPPDLRALPARRGRTSTPRSRRSRRGSAPPTRRSRAAKAALSSYRLSALADESKELSRLAAERRFSWTLLLARLEKTLPGDVGVVRLQPMFDKDGEVVARPAAGRRATATPWSRRSRRSRRTRRSGRSSCAPSRARRARRPIRSCSSFPACTRRSRGHEDRLRGLAPPAAARRGGRAVSPPATSRSSWRTGRAQRRAAPRSRPAATS